MDFKTLGDAIAQRKQRAWIGFQQTIQLGKFYTQEDIKIKNEWVKEIEAANDEWRKWLSSN
ncbi:hypothetical protein SDA20_10215 [Legionella pneumophila serogroup 1]|nr:hypothetical protein [Legionella pneumophila]HDO9974352.1 hypothetical protein [Legionella pneumophila]